MTLLVQETGQAAANANTFVLAADVDAYAAARGNPLGWDTLSPTAKEAAIVIAADYLRNEMRFLYKGLRQTLTQSMPWPRTGAVEQRGQAIPDSFIPWRLLQAQCELAIRVGDAIDVQPDLERGGLVQSESVDVIRVSYFQNAPGETLITVVMGFLQTLLRPTMTPLAPVYEGVSPTEHPEFANDAFNYSGVRRSNA